MTTFTLILAGLLAGYSAQAGDHVVPAPANNSMVFFVDPAAGNDAADGLSPKTAWKTWGSFQAKARPGCSLLLKRGCIYSLPLPLLGGAAGAPVVYGAYGDGPKPVLQSKLVDLSHPDAWTQEGSGIWRTRNPMPEVANLILDDVTCGDMRYEKALLKKQGEWFDGKGTLFVFSSGNPATIWKNVELVSPGNGVTFNGPAFSHIRFENLSFRKIGTHGIQLVEGPVGVTIRRCDFRLIGGAIFPDDTMPRAYGGERFIQRRVRYGNGIESWQGASDVVIEECRISDIFDGGICIQGVAGSTAKNVAIRNNVIWNCGYDCLDIAHGVLTVNVLFENNTCRNGGEGWALQGEPRPRYSLNVPDQIGYLCNLENSFGWNDKCAVTIRNNIFCNASESRCFNFGRKPLGNVDLVQVDHNCYFQANPADALVKIGPRPFTAAQFDDYRKAYGWDQNSLIGDPLFVNPSEGDFRLQPNSPCAGFGAQFGLCPEQVAESLPKGPAMRVQNAKFHRFEKLRAGRIKTERGWNVADFALSMFNPSLTNTIKVTWALIADDPDCTFKDGRKVTWTKKFTLGSDIAAPGRKHKSPHSAALAPRCSARNPAHESCDVFASHDRTRGIPYFIRSK